MFSTAGYFKGLPCPFFLSGLCERPYCHFKHSKPEEGKPQLQRSTSSSSYIESLSDKPWSTKLTSSTDTSTDVEAVQVNHKNGEKFSSSENPTKEIIGYNKYTGDPIYEEFKQETYEVGSPTADVLEYGGGNQIPVAFNKYTGKPIYNNESGSQHATPENSVLEYKPTPIEELKKQNNKYTSLTTIQNDNQYDPEQNYSTKTITASHSLPFAPKRMISYEPTKIRPKKLARSNSYQFDISQFSDSDENEDEKLDDEDEEYSPLAVSDIKGETKEDNSTGKKTNQKKDDSDTQITKSDVDSIKFVKNVKYFENLLLSDPKKSTFESIQKNKLIEKVDGHLEDNADKDHASSKNGELKTQENRNEKKGDKITKRESNENGEKSVSQSKNEKSLTNSEENKISCEKSKQSENRDKNKNSSGKHNHSSSSKNSHSNTNSPHRSESGHRKSSNSSHGKSEKSHRKHSDSSKGEINGSKSHEKSSVSSSDFHKSRQSSHKSSHSKTHKDSERTKSSDKHGKSGSHDKKSDSSKLEKSSGNKHGNSSDREHSHKSSHGEKLSSKKHSERSSKSTSDSHKSSSDKKHKTDERKSHHSSNKSSSSENKHSNKSVEKSSKVKTEKRLSNDNDSKKHIIDVNVDLFGEDSDVELLDDSDIESHPLIQDSDLSDNDPYDECLQIFKESHQAKSRQIKKTSPEKKKNEDPIMVGKKRVAHHTSTTMKRKIPEKPFSKLSPAQVMHNRFLEMRKKALEEAAKLHSNPSTSSSSNPSTSVSSTSASSSSSSNNKLSRVAHKPASSAKSKTVITTASKTEKRRARVPNVSNLARPQIPAEFGSKVPTNIRQRYLNLIIDECLKLYDDEEEAFKRGQEEEMAVYKRSNTKTIYLNVAINAIKRLRNEIAESLPSTSKKPKMMNVMKLSHEAILGGKNATKTSYTIKRSGNSTKIVVNFKGAELYKRLNKYILTEEQLKENGFPMSNPDNPGSAIINKEKVYKKNDRLYEKICVRCGNKFIVYPTGKYAKQEECTYHWAKAWKRKVNGLFDSRYNCCGGDFSSEGCQVAKNHVHETNKWENLSGYIKSLPCSPPLDGDYGVFAMDCEMVYTTAGMELARVTVSDQDNNAVFETLVKPDSEVVDLNTRFSGITEDDLEGVTTSLRDVQAVLLSLFTDRTILIGHSLESDLTAVKIIHNTVVDTSLVFPHRLGPPYKRALRTLMAEYLQKIIQDDVGGHDSMEDAVSCMELMHMKLKEDARKENR